MEWQTCDVAVDQRYYAKPVSIHYEVQFAYSSDPSTNAYLPLKREDWQKIREFESKVARGDDITLAGQGSRQSNNYASVGRYWYLGWTPDVAVSAGLEATFVPVLSMAADSDVPHIHLNLHYGIVLDAVIMALEETPEDTARYEKHRDRIAGKIAIYYRKSASGAEMLRPNLGHSKAY
jgi:hypothetical protein